MKNYFKMASGLFNQDMAKYLEGEGWFSRKKIDTEYDRGYTLLTWFTVSGKPDYLNVVKKCLEAGYNPDRTDNNGNTPLTLAARNSRYDAAKLLIEHGANVNKTNSANSSPLALAANNNHQEITELLLQKGAYPDPVDTYNHTPLTWAFEAPRDSTETIITLLNYDADVDKQDKYGYTALHQAITAYGIDNERVVKTILKKNPDLTKTNDEGHTPLKLAKEKGEESIVKLLKTERKIRKQTRGNDQNGHSSDDFNLGL